MFALEVILPLDEIIPVLRLLTAALPVTDKVPVTLAPPELSTSIEDPFTVPVKFPLVATTAKLVNPLAICVTATFDTTVTFDKNPPSPSIYCPVTLPVALKLAAITFPTTFKLLLTLPSTRRSVVVVKFPINALPPLTVYCPVTTLAVTSAKV